MTILLEWQKSNQSSTSALDRNFQNLETPNYSTVRLEWLISQVFIIKSLDFDRQNLAEVIPIRPRLNAIKEEHADPEIQHLPKEVRISFQQKHNFYSDLGYKSHWTISTSLQWTHLDWTTSKRAYAIKCFSNDWKFTWLKLWQAN